MWYVLAAAGQWEFWAVRCLQIVAVSKGLILQKIFWTEKILSWMSLQQHIAVGFCFIQCWFKCVLLFLICCIRDKLDSCFSFIFSTAFITLSTSVSWAILNFWSETWPNLLWPEQLVGEELQLQGWELHGLLYKRAESSPFPRCDLLLVLLGVEGCLQSHAANWRKCSSRHCYGFSFVIWFKDIAKFFWLDLGIVGHLSLAKTLLYSRSFCNECVYQLISHHCLVSGILT